jgi:hypothetical protein
VFSWYGVIIFVPMLQFLFQAKIEWFEDIIEKGLKVKMWDNKCFNITNYHYVLRLLHVGMMQSYFGIRL